MPSVVHAVVFALEPGGGNPGPVVLEADTLNDSAMQAIAASFRQETAFVLRPTIDGCSVRLRFFVPDHEMDMCVHGTLAAVAVLASRSMLASPITLETLLGPISARWRAGMDGFEVSVQLLRPTFADAVPSSGEVARALGIAETDLDLTVGPVQCVSIARPKLIVPMRDHQALDAIRPDFEFLWDLCDRYEATGFYPFTVRPRRKGLDAEARQFPLRAGFLEDPATGVAAGALAAYLVRHVSPVVQTRGWISFVIGQGFALGRPSSIRADVRSAGRDLLETRVGGQASIVGEAGV